MKRTISEVIELIKQKKDSAEQEHEQLYVSFIGKNMPIEKQNLYAKLCGNEEAYTDILALLESSHLVEQEKALKILKKAFDINVEKIEKGVFVSYKLTTHKRCKYLSPEEHKLFNEVFKDNE